MLPEKWRWSNCPLTGFPVITIVAFLLTLSLVAVPIYIAVKRPEQWNTLAQTLFQIGLSAASIWFGYSAAGSKKRDALQWLQAAVQTCNELAAICWKVERLQRQQSAACDDVRKMIPDDPKGDGLLGRCMRQACDNSLMTLTHIAIDVQNAHDLLLRFLEANCDNDECARIKAALEKRKHDLARMEAEIVLPAPA